MKTRLFLFAFVLLINCSLQANPSTYRGDYLPPPQPDYQTVKPAKLIKDGLENMRKFLSHADSTNPVHLRAFLNEQVSPYFDFEQMAAWVARPFYQRMNDQNKSKIQSQLKEMFLSTLTQQIGTFTNPQPRIDFLPARKTSANDMVVNARILPAQGYPMRLSFRLHRGGKGWKIIDASSNGTSAVMFYRQYFVNLMRRAGPKTFQR